MTPATIPCDLTAPDGETYTILAACSGVALKRCQRHGRDWYYVTRADGTWFGPLGSSPDDALSMWGYCVTEALRPRVKLRPLPPSCYYRQSSDSDEICARTGQRHGEWERERDDERAWDTQEILRPREVKV